MFTHVVITNCHSRRVMVYGVMVRVRVIEFCWCQDEGGTSPLQSGTAALEVLLHLSAASVVCPYISSLIRADYTFSMLFPPFSKNI